MLRIVVSKLSSLLEEAAEIYCLTVNPKIQIFQFFKFASLTIINMADSHDNDDDDNSEFLQIQRIQAKQDTQLNAKSSGPNDIKSPGRSSYANVVPFSALCELFERISKTTKPAQKKRSLQSFFSHYHDDDYFPLMRLLLPQVRQQNIIFSHLAR